MRRNLTPKTLARIRVADGGHQPIAAWNDFISGCSVAGHRLSPFEFQRSVCGGLIDGGIRSGLIVKSRQLGLTLTTALTMAYLAQLRPGIQLSALSIRQEDSSAIGKRIRKAAGHLLKTTSDNVLELALSNGSLVRYLSANSSDPGRGNANVQGLFVDEAGFYPYRDLLAALAPGTLWATAPWQLAVTTPSDTESQFYEDFCKGLSRPYDELAGAIVSGELPPHYFENNSGQYRSLIHFTAVPKFKSDPQSYLRVLLDAGLSPQDVEREANLAWLTQSSTLVFDPVKIRSATMPAFTGSLSGRVVLGIDPSGFGADKFAAVALRVIPESGRVQVLWGRTWDVYDGSRILADLESALGGVIGGDITIEVNGVGAGFVDLLSSDPRFGRFTVTPHTTTKQSKSKSIAFTEWLLKSQRLAIFAPEISSQLAKYQIDKVGKTGRGGDDLALAFFHALSGLDGVGGGFSSWYKKFWLTDA
jgi:hypothetical protein